MVDSKETPEQINARFAQPISRVDKPIGHLLVQQDFTQLAHRINNSISDGREKSLALTKLEEAYMWAGKGLALEDE